MIVATCTKRLPYEWQTSRRKVLRANIQRRGSVREQPLLSNSAISRSLTRFHRQLTQHHSLCELRVAALQRLAASNARCGIFFFSWKDVESLLRFFHRALLVTMDALFGGRSARASWLLLRYIPKSTSTRAVIVIRQISCIFFCGYPFPFHLMFISTSSWLRISVREKECSALALLATRTVFLCIFFLLLASQKY